MGFFTTEFATDGFNSSLSASFQGQLASTYTNALMGEVMNLSDYVGFLYFQQTGDLNGALAAVESVEAGQFSLVDVFSAAQSKTSAVGGGSIADPDPKVLVNGEYISIKAMLTGLDTESWKDSGKTGQFHTREFFTDTKMPEGYDPDWSNVEVNEAPVAADFDFGMLLETAANADGTKQAGDFTVSVDLDDLVSDDQDLSELTFDIGALPAGVTYDPAENRLHIDPNSAVFDEIKAGASSPVYEITYTVTDAGGLSDTGKISFQIEGTKDLYQGSASQTFTRLGNDRSFEETFGVEDGFDYTGTITVSGSADLNATNETLIVTADGVQVFNDVVLGNNNSGTEDFIDYTSGPVAVSALAWEEGVIVTVDFSTQVAQGSTATIELDYSYWA